LKLAGSYALSFYPNMAGPFSDPPGQKQTTTMRPFHQWRCSNPPDSGKKTNALECTDSFLDGWRVAPNSTIEIWYWIEASTDVSIGAHDKSICES
jgi:hypothetical protein